MAYTLPTPWQNRAGVERCNRGETQLITFTPKNIDMANHLHQLNGYKTVFSILLDDVKLEVVEKAGITWIDIRHWGKYKDRLIPTKKGIRLPLHRFARLLWLQDQVADAMKDMKDGKRVDKSLLVGGGVRLLLCSPFRTVHIREYYRRYSKATQGHKGLILGYKQWLGLLHVAKKDAMFKMIVPHFKHITPCYTHADHRSHKTARSCAECNFFTAAEEESYL